MVLKFKARPLFRKDAIKIKYNSTARMSNYNRLAKKAGPGFVKDSCGGLAKVVTRRPKY